MVQKILRADLTPGESLGEQVKSKFQSNQDLPIDDFSVDSPRRTSSATNAAHSRAIPPIFKIPNGFDAIFQLRGDVLSNIAGRSLRTRVAASNQNEDLTDTRSERTNDQRNAVISLRSQPRLAALDVDALPDKVRHEITVDDARRSASDFPLLDEVNLETESGARVVGEDLSLYADFIELRLDPENSNSVQLVWDLRVDFGRIIERNLKSGRGYGNSSFVGDRKVRDLVESTDSVRTIERETLDSATLTAEVPLETAVRESRGVMLAEIDLTRAEYEINLVGEVFDRYRDRVELGLERLYLSHKNTGRVQITPTISFTGRNTISNGDSGVGSLDVSPVVTYGNRPGIQNRVLSLCVERTGRTGDPSGVLPFVGDSSYGYYVSEEIIRPITTALWEQSPSQGLPLVGEGPVELTSSRKDITVYAGYEVSLGSVRRFALVPGNESVPDYMTFQTTLTLTVNELWRDESKRDSITDVDGLGEPTEETVTIQAFPFNQKTGRSEAASGALVSDQLNHVFDPLYRPFRDDITVRSIRGRVSGPLGGVFLRGEIRER
jgi:hypothetical protein